MLAVAYFGPVMAGGLVLRPPSLVCLSLLGWRGRFSGGCVVGGLALAVARQPPGSRLLGPGSVCVLPPA